MTLIFKVIAYDYLNLTKFKFSLYKHIYIKNENIIGVPN